MEWESSLLALSTRKMMAMAGHRGVNRSLCLGHCLGISVCVVAVPGALIPVPGVPVMPHSVEFDNRILTNNQKDSIHQKY